MFDASKLITGADNLFRFFSFAGLIIIGLAFIFPKERQKEIDFDLIEFKKQKDIFESEIAHLKKGVTDLNLIISEIKNKVFDLAAERDSLLKNNKNGVNTTKIEALKQKKDELKMVLSQKFEKIEDNTFKVSLRQIELESLKTKVVAAQNYLDSYTKFFWSFLIFGTGLSVYGFYKWHCNQKVADEMQRTQLDIAKKDLNGNNN